MSLNLIEMERMQKSDFQGFGGTRQILRTMNRVASKESPLANRAFVLDAAEAAKVGEVEGKEFAELVSATDIGATADVLDRAIIAAYQDALLDNPEADLSVLFAKRPVDDFIFRSIHYSDIQNFDKRKAQEGYRAAFLDVSASDKELEFYGKLVDVSWKAWRSNRGEILRTLPERLGKAGRRTQLRIMAEQIGLKANRDLIYTVGNGNLFTLGLTETNLETMLNAMKTQIDPMTGEPRGTVMTYLVVPQALEWTARRIIKPYIDTLAIASLAGNYQPKQLTLIVNPMLDRYTTTGFWLFAKPSGSQGAFVDAFLNGQEAPEIFIRMSDAQRIAGGGPEELGSFRTDNISWKGRFTRETYPELENYWMTAFSEPLS